MRAISPQSAAVGVIYIFVQFARYDGMGFWGKSTNVQKVHEIWHSEDVSDRAPEGVALNPTRDVSRAQPKFQGRKENDLMGKFTPPADRNRDCNAKSRRHTSAKL